MKPRNLSGKIRNHTTIWLGCATACCALSFSASAGTPAAPTSAPAPAATTNSIGFTVGGVASYGDKAAFQRRFSQNGDLFGGISDLSLQSKLNDTTTLSLDGHALFGLEDYGVVGTVEKEDLGYIKAGYKQFRTWYDASGGYAQNSATSKWVPLYDDDVSLDRGEVFFEAGLRMEDLPEITFRYSHAWRDGTKDSTVWGGLPAAGGNFKSLPSLLLIDETTDTFRLDVTHTVGNTDFGGGVSFLSIDNNDTRVMRNGATAANMGLGTRVPDTAAFDSDIFNGHLFSETHFSERLMVSFGYSYTNFNTDIGGNRPSNDVPTGNLLTGADHAGWGIMGGNQGTENVINANLWWNPNDCIVIVPSLRAEFWDQDGWANHLSGVRNNNVVAVPGQTVDDIVQAALGGTYPGVGPNYGDLEELRSFNSDEYQEFSETIEARYSGLDDVLLYAKAEFSQLDGDIARNEIGDFHTLAAPTTDNRTIDSETDKQKYTIGANWYPVSGLSVSAQGFYKNSDTYLNSGGTEAPFLRQSNYDTTDANIRVSWRAMPNLTLVSRYDYQQTTFEAQGINGVPLALIDSADIDSHIFSQSVTWMPVDRAYVQGSVSYVVSQTDTPADTNNPAVTTDSDNDYLTANLTTGYALDDKTDVTASYSYYYSDNYMVPTTGMGYGTSVEEHVFSVSLNRQITPNMMWNLGYGYYTGDDEGAGSFNDYSAHMVSTGLQIRF
jgi:hypothetical protein